MNEEGLTRCRIRPTQGAENEGVTHVTKHREGGRNKDN
jgi:hypothetical protein